MGGNSLSQGRVHQMVIQLQMVGPENTHTINIILTEKVTFRNIYVYTYINATTINEKAAMNSKESKGRCMERFGARRKGEIM